MSVPMAHGLAVGGVVASLVQPEGRLGPVGTASNTREHPPERTQIPSSIIVDLGALREFRLSKITGPPTVRVKKLEQSKNSSTHLSAPKSPLLL